MFGALRGIVGNRGLRTSVKKVLYEKVVVATVMYGSELWDAKIYERQKLVVFDMKCLRSLVGVSRMDRIRNEEIRERTGIRSELAKRVDRNILGW